MYISEDENGSWIDLLSLDEGGEVEEAASKTVAAAPGTTVVIVGAGGTESKSDTTTATPWYREPVFVGGVISVVVLAVLGVLVSKASSLVEAKL